MNSGLKPSSKIFLLNLPRRNFYCAIYVYSIVLFLSCAFHAFASLHCLLGKG